MHKNYTDTCGSSKLADCLRHLYYKGHVDPHNHGIFPYIHDKQLVSICESYEDTHKCIEESLHECNIHEIKQLEAKDEALRYLCNEGLSGYTESRDCFVREDVLSEAHHCNTTFTTAVHSLKKSQEDLSQQRDQMCRYINDYESCLRTAVTDQCGHQAGEWTYAMKSKLLQPTVVEMGCADNTDNLAAVIAVSFAIVIGIVFLLIALYIFVRCLRDGALFATTPTEHRPTIVHNVRLKKLTNNGSDDGIRPLLDTQASSSRKPPDVSDKRAFSDDEECVFGNCDDCTEECEDKYMIRCSHYHKSYPTHL